MTNLRSLPFSPVQSRCFHPFRGSRLIIAFGLLASAGFILAAVSAATADLTTTATLAVSANPAAGGTVTGGGTFAIGSTQTITATPAAGFEFAGWSDGTAGPTRQVPVPAAGVTVVANFRSITHTLIIVVDPAAGGTVTRDPSKTSYAHAEKVILSAQPLAGHAFAGWVDVAPPPPVISPADGSPTVLPVPLPDPVVNPPVLIAANPLTLSMTRNFTLIARFVPATTGPEIDVQGRGVSIVSGDTTPGAADDTEFGTVPVLVPVPVNGALSSGGSTTVSGAAAVTNGGAVNSPSVRHTFVIRSAGTEALNLTGSPAVAKSGANAADFIITQPAVVGLAPGRAVPFDVTFLPSAAGVRTATLAIASNDRDENPYTFVVRGTGGPVMAPYLPTAQQTSIKVASDAGEFRATVAIEFNMGGYVVDWGQVVLQQNTITLNARIFQSTGAVTQAFTAQSHVYPLGPLAAGGYQLVFKVADQTVKTASFGISTLATSVAPAGAGRVWLAPPPVGAGSYLTGTTVSLRALPSPSVPVPLANATTTPSPAGTVAPPTVMPAPVPPYVFKNWSGDATGAANPVSLTVDANKSVTANFAAAPGLPTVTTGPVTDITATGAKLQGAVVAIGGSPVTERGFVLGTVIMATTATSTGTVPTNVTTTTTATGAAGAVTTKLVEGSGTGPFARTLTALPPGTTFFVRAFATNTAGTAYGQTLTFTTLRNPGTNTPPTISDIRDQAIGVGASTGPLAFTVGDAETAPENLSVVGVASSPLPLANIADGSASSPLPVASFVFGGSGANRTVTVTPAPNQSGTIMIAITVRDAGGLTASDSFKLTIGSPPPGLSATLTARPNSYSSAGGSVTFTANLAYSGTMAAAGLSVGGVPPGWTYGSTGGPNLPSVAPAAGASGHFEFGFPSAPASPATFTFTVNYPAGLSGNQVFSGISGFLRSADGTVQTVSVPAVALPGSESPTIVTAPRSRAVRLGGTAVFNVVTGGAGPFTYQWKKDGVAVAGETRIGGATGGTLTIANAQFADAGAYTVVVGSAAGTVTSAPAAMLAVVDAQHAIAGTNTAASGSVTIRNTLTFAGAPTALGWQAILPEGWSYATGSGAEGDIKPAVGATGVAEWAWTTVPASPVSFSYTLNVPAGAAGDKALQALNVFRLASGPTNILVLPDPLVLPNSAARHSADTNGDFRISLTEITRVIELYNTRNGTTRTGMYAVAAGASEDGFAPEPARANSAAAVLARFYSADSNRDGKLSLLELTRVVELYNTRNGTLRTGAYHAQGGSEDGFAPGP